MSTTVEINNKNLAQIIKAFKNVPVGRVGILGDQGSREFVDKKKPSEITFESLMRRKTEKAESPNKGVTSTNAEVGAAHEYGAPARGLPQRSFLRIPLTEHLNEYLEKAGAFDKEALAEVVRSGSCREWVSKCAVVATTVVADAFDSGGFGKWPGWKDPKYQNNTGMVLVDSQQLRNSISWDVVKK